MIVAPALQQRYNAELPLVKEVEKRVDATLIQFCKVRGLAFSGRIKTIQSIAEKIEGGRYESWSAIDDWYACTIVIPTVSNEQDVLSFLQSTFHEVTLKKRGDSKRDPNHFRFDNTRFYGRIISPSGAIQDDNYGVATGGRAENISQITFEVQIRTAFEHAWQVATHPLTYKADRIDWRRQRIAAQMRAMVEQLDLLVAGFDDLEPHVTPSPDERTAAKVAVLKQFQSLHQRGKIPDEVTPKDWGRFADNVLALLSSATRIAGDKPTALLNQVECWILSRESDNFPLSISLFQIVVGVASTDPNFQIKKAAYHLAISSELENFFPGVCRFQRRFSYEK